MSNRIRKTTDINGEMPYMKTLNRRAFGMRLLAAGGSLPLLNSPLAAQEKAGTAPDTIAGYTLKAEDKQLVGKFLTSHEKNMKSLRGNDLPNSLAPDFIFASPRTRKRSN